MNIETECASVVTSPNGLRRAHISEVPSLGHLFEAIPASSHGDRTRRTLGSVSGPTTEARNDPGEPGDRVARMLGLFAWQSFLRDGPARPRASSIDPPRPRRC